MTCRAVRTPGDVYATAGHSVRIAAASSGVSFDCPVKMRAPDCVTAPGKTMMKFEPRELIVDWIERDAPDPTATMAMTHATPTTIPSIVSDERSLLRAIARRPTRRMFHRRSVLVLMDAAPRCTPA